MMCLTEFYCDSCGTVVDEAIFFNVILGIITHHHPECFGSSTKGGHMFEIPYDDTPHYCSGCGFPIRNSPIADPKSDDRERPNYFHFGCYMNQERREQNGKESA